MEQKRRLEQIKNQKLQKVSIKSNKLFINKTRDKKLENKKIISNLQHISHKNVRQQRSKSFSVNNAYKPSVLQLENSNSKKRTKTHRQLMKEIENKTKPTVRENIFSKHVIDRYQEEKLTIEPKETVNHTFVFIVYGYNCEEYCIQNLKSINTQTYTNWRIIYINDGSDDMTDDLVYRYVKKNDIGERFTYIQNFTTKTKAYNLYNSFKMCNDDDICCLMDGTDTLATNEVLQNLNTFYNKHNISFTYGNNFDEFQKEYRLKNEKNSGVLYPNEYLHSGYGELFKTLELKYFKDHKNEWMRCYVEQAILYGVMNNYENKHMKVDFPTYVYNYDNSINTDISQDYKTELNKVLLNMKSKLQVEKNLSTKSILYDSVIKNNELKTYLVNNKINQIKISYSLKHFDRIKNMYELSEYNNKNNPCLFFGVYTRSELRFIKNHKGPKYIMYGGTDCDTRLEIYKSLINEIKTLENTYFIAQSKDIESRLTELGIRCVYLHLDLVDTSIFKPVDPEKERNCIYVYDGQGSMMSTKKMIYNHKLIEEVKRKLPEYEYIHSSLLGQIPYEQMPRVYEKCFIGLRLTEKDGNANTVQEFEAMNIPIVHNQSEYGLKWKNVDDIITHISIKTQIIIYSHIRLSNIGGDTIWQTNLTNKLLSEGNKVIILTKYRDNNNFLRNIENSANLKVIYRDSDDKLIDIIDNSNFSNIIIRNHNILHRIKHKDWLHKCIIYGLDIHLDGIINLDNKFHELWTQSDKLKELFIENGVRKEKIIITEPFARKYDFDLPERNDDEIRLIYCGTLRDEENILEIIEEFQKIRKERPEVQLKIVYGKIVGDEYFKYKINSYIKNGVHGITFKHNLTHKESCYEIATSDVGICWRKNGWGDNGEVSTKVKYYEIYKLEIMRDNTFFNILSLFKKENIIVPCLNNNEFQKIDYTLKSNIITKNYTKFQSVDGKNLNYNEYVNTSYHNIYKQFCKNTELNKKFEVSKLLNECQEYEKKNKTKRINTSGAYGNLHTFINIFEYAIKMKLQKILILEPDVYLHKKFFYKLCEYNKIIKESDILYLGASQHNYKNIIDKINGELKQYNNIYKQYYTTGNFGIIYDSIVFQDILYLLKCKLFPSDVVPLKLKNGKSYVCYPNIVICDLSSSNTSNSRNQHILNDKFNWDINLYDISNIIYINKINNNSDIYLEININSYKKIREGFIRILETDIPKIYLPDEGLKIGDNYYILIPYNVLTGKTSLKVYYNNLFINKITIKTTINISKKNYILNMKRTYNIKLPFYYDHLSNDYYELLKYGLKCFDNYIKNKKVCNYIKNKKNVMFLLHTLPEYEWQGFTKRTVEQLSIIKKLGINLFPCSRYGYPYDCKYIDSTNVKNKINYNNIIYYKLLNGLDNRFNYGIIEYIKKYSDRVIEFIIENNIGILHANTNFWNGIVAYIVKKILNIKVIYEIRGFWHDSQNSNPILHNSDMVHAQEKVEHEIIDNIKNIITLSNSFKNRLLKNVNENLNIYVLPNIILPFTQEYNKNVLTKYKINICKSKLKIGYIGNLSKYEGLQNLIDAVSSNPLYELLIFGNGNFDYHNIGDNITYYGTADKEDVYTLYNIFDVVCYPRKDTYVTRETQSSKIFEVIELEIPLILSNLPVNREIHDKLLFCESDDTTDLKDKLNYVRTNYKKYKNIMKEIKSDVIRKYNQENNLKIYKQLYM